MPQRAALWRRRGCCAAAAGGTGAGAPGAAAAVAAARKQQQQQQAPQLQPPPLLARHQRLKDPAEIGASSSSTVEVRDAGGAVGLDAYMRLPVEQYYILDPKQIQFLSGNSFVLRVPKVQLLGATLQPVIRVQVKSGADCVVLQATDCQLNATGIMGGLDDRFAMEFTTTLRWAAAHTPQQQQQQQQQQLGAAAPHPRQRPTAGEEQQPQQPQQQQQPQQPPSLQQQQRESGWDRLRRVSWPRASNSNGGGGAAGGGNAQGAGGAPPARAAASGSITGRAQVNVWCEVIPPFHLMPKEVLVGSCNLVISGLVQSLLPWFMRQLAADYSKWATDEAYRQERSMRTAQKQAAAAAAAATQP